MSVWADDAGLVHLWAEQAESPKNFLLECDESGERGQYPFDLSDPETFLPATPRVLPAGRRELPALSDDPMRLSQAELLEAGYPPRPDAAAAPEAYATWLDAVSEPMTFVEPHLVERTDVHFGPISTATSTNWSGTVLQDGTPRYVWALGTIYVPTFSNPPGLSSSRIAPWVGLDGWGGTNHVVQDGFFYDNVGGVGTYSAWYEYFPEDPVFNTSMTVSPGDSMLFYAWVGDSSCQLSSTDEYGCFWYKNDSTGVTAGTFKVAEPAGVNFVGSSAEAIYERVTGDPVSQFSGTPGITDYGAYDANSTLHGHTSDPYDLVRLVNGSGETLVQPFTAGSLGEPEENDVGFIWEQAQ